MATRRRTWFNGWPRLPRMAALVEIAAVAGASAFFLALGRLYGSEPITNVDFAAQRLAQSLRGPELTQLMETASRLGAEWLWVAWGPVALLLAATRRWPSALALVLVAYGTHPLNSFLKDLYQRVRPSELGSGAQAFSFPSGHAMAAGAVYGMLLLIAWRELRGRTRWVAMAVCVALALLVAASRVYLNVHYLSDVVAGLVVGALWADAVLIGWRLLARATARARVSRPTHAPSALDVDASPKGPLSNPSG